ncbi:260_t:CDS:2 [Gigaspora margarita]|uniref:260_t:CDS:1 n=1 Tax=Gigaspora margarita TaxID=4874 RepID=A0ABN7V9R8_GIGMA|nr:260_t:CDS:2 [Gigaspora margarita]
MAEVKISKFIPTIKTILKNSDPNKITARDIRMKLEKDFKVDLAPRKHEVQQLIEQCFDEINEDSVNSSDSLEDFEDFDESSKKSRQSKTSIKSNGTSDYSSLEDDDYKSPQKKKKRGRKPKSSTELLSDVVKRLWVYIKENSLQDPNDKRFIVCDDNLKNIFKQDRIHSFTMNKYLTDHLKKKEDLIGGETFTVSSNGSHQMEPSNASSAGDDELQNDDEFDGTDDHNYTPTSDLMKTEKEESKNVKLEE